jgi:hypothetical protein
MIGLKWQNACDLVTDHQPYFGLLTSPSCVSFKTSKYFRHPQKVTHSAMKPNGNGMN